MKKVGVGTILGVFVGFAVSWYMMVFTLMQEFDQPRPGSAPGTFRAEYDQWFEVGQRVESSGLVLSVQSVREDAELARRSGALAGSTMVLVDVALENVRAEEPLFYSPFLAVVFLDREPGTRRAELVDAGGGNLRSGHLAPGEQIQGFIVFEVPAGVKPSRFKYGEQIYRDSAGFPGWAPIQVRLQ